MWVLIIDDDDEDIEFFSEAMQELRPGHTCVGVSNCEKGLTRLRNEAEMPSHIFLDGMLYGMSSIECLRRLKKDERAKGIKVIMYSGFAGPGFKEEFLAEGAERYLIKPASRSDLLFLLSEIFENS